jgi:predicted PurR-regulated permease PerM
VAGEPYTGNELMATGTSETSGRDEGGEVEHPDLGKLEDALRDRGEIRSVGITLLLVLAVFYTLYFARSFFLPVVLAVLLDFLLSPIIRFLKRWRVPESLGAAIVVASLLGLVGAGAYSLTDPARAWVAKAPESLQKIQSRLQKLRKPVEQVSRTAEQVEEATKLGSSPVQEVVLRGPTIRERIFGSTQDLLAGALEVVVLLYFLLAVGDLFLEKLIKVLPQLGDKKKAVTIVRETEASISTYLFTLALVNTGLGLVVALVMYLVGMPNPLLWGALAGLAEFVPYLGATVMLIVLSLAGLVTFPLLSHAMLVPGAYLAVNLVQANFVTPTVLGRRLTLNPVAILLGLVFWWWLWGVGGAFIAVPILATFKIFCDHIEALAPIGEFLGESDRRVSG